MVVKIILYLINIDKNGSEIPYRSPPPKAMPGQSPGRKRTTNKALRHDIDAKRREAEKLSPRPRHLLLLDRLGGPLFLYLATVGHLIISSGLVVISLYRSVPVGKALVNGTSWPPQRIRPQPAGTSVM